MASRTHAQDSNRRRFRDFFGSRSRGDQPPAASLRASDGGSISNSAPRDSQSAVARQRRPAQDSVSQDALPGSTARNAEDSVNKAADELKKLIPEEFIGSVGLEPGLVARSADINSLSRQISSTVGILMDRRSVDKSKQGFIKVVTSSWVKTALPYIQQGLSAAHVPFQSFET